MEVFYILLSLALLSALIYVIMKLQVSRMVDERLEKTYRAQVKSDIHEFYREMENYSALLENRVSRFKKLIEKQEENLKRWEEIFEKVKKSKKGKEISEFIETSLAREKEIIHAFAALKSPGRSEEQRSEASGDKPRAEKRVRPSYQQQRKNTLPEKERKQPAAARPQPDPGVTGELNQNRYSENYNPAEELLASETVKDHYHAPAHHETDLPPVYGDGPSPAEVAPHEPVGRRNSGLKRFFAGVGNALSPLFYRGPDEVAHTRRTGTFADRLSERAPAPPPGRTAPPTQSRKPEPPAADSRSDSSLAYKKIDPAELDLLISRIKSDEGRLSAIGELIDRRFDLKDISQLCDIPVGELEIQAGLHALRRKS